MSNDSLTSMLDETIVIPANSLLKVYKDVCSRAEKRLAITLDSNVDTFLDNLNYLHYLNGQADLLEILLQGVYSKELLKSIRGSLGLIKDIKRKGGE